MKRLKRFFPWFLVLCGLYLGIQQLGSLSVVNGQSMQPVFEDGDVIWSFNTTWYKRLFGALDYNDYVLVQKNQTNYIKRILALPDDTVGLNHNHFLVNQIATLPPEAMLNILYEPKLNRSLELRAFLKDIGIAYKNTQGNLFQIKTTSSIHAQIDSCNLVRSTMLRANVKRQNDDCLFPMILERNEVPSASEYFVVSQDLLSGVDSRNFCAVKQSEITHVPVLLIYGKRSKAYGYKRKNALFRRL